MSAHTKGPWRREKPEHELIRMDGQPMMIRGRSVPGTSMMQTCADIQIWADGEHGAGGFYKGIALLPMGEGDAEDEANARLIAAAPDLLEAAKKGLEVAESWIHDQLDGTSLLDSALEELEPVRAVIQSAEEGS